MKITAGLSDSRGMLHWVVGTLLAACATALMVWLGADAATAGMVFLVLVVVLSTQAGQWLALYIALLCALCFDYFFLLPYHTLWLEGAQAWVAMSAFAVSCAVVSRVAKRERSQTRQADERRQELERLYELSQEMMLQEDAARLLRDLPRMIARIFALDGVVLYVHDLDQFHASGTELPMGIEADLKSITLGHSSMLTLPNGFTMRTLLLGLRPVGALGYRPDRLSRAVATAVSAQVAIALTRAIAIETSTRLEAVREGERLRTALIDSLTHELRTPLTAIRAAATTLLEGGGVDDVNGLDEAARRELAAVIDEESLRLDRLIGEAVEMAEIDAHVVEVRLTPQLPRALLEQAIEESRRVLRAHRMVVTVEEADDAGQPVWFDPHLLGRVLRHLLENAARYSPPGGRILLSCRSGFGRLEFRVEDDGPGIDKIDLPFIFEKFYRGRKRTGKGKGTGMGLAIVRAILEAHGGGIEVVNAPGKGACFRFWVPLVEKEPGSVAEQDRAK